MQVRWTGNSNIQESWRVDRKSNSYLKWAYSHFYFMFILISRTSQKETKVHQKLPKAESVIQYLYKLYPMMQEKKVSLTLFSPPLSLFLLSFSVLTVGHMTVRMRILENHTLFIKYNFTCTTVQVKCSVICFLFTYIIFFLIFLFFVFSNVQNVLW